MLTIIDQYRILHDRGYFGGGSLMRHLPEIKGLVDEHKAETLLDYGCGKAKCWRQGWAQQAGISIMPTLYDPALRVFENKPAGKFDGVICTDVLEHVENPDAVIAELIGYAKKFLFLAISVRESPPKKKLLDGRPMHIQVHPPQWWADRIRADIPVILRFDEAG